MNVSVDISRLDMRDTLKIRFPALTSSRPPNTTRLVPSTVAEAPLAARAAPDVLV